MSFPGIDINSLLKLSSSNKTSREESPPSPKKEALPTTSDSGHNNQSPTNETPETANNNALNINQILNNSAIQIQLQNLFKNSNNNNSNHKNQESTEEINQTSLPIIKSENSAGPCITNNAQNTQQKPQANSQSHPNSGHQNQKSERQPIIRTKQDSIIRAGYGPSSIVGNTCLLNTPTTPTNINTAPVNGMIQDIPSIPLEYLKAQFKTYDSRDIECTLCGHLFKAGKYKVNNTKLRQHVLAKHKDHLNVWLKNNGNNMFSDQHFELFERPWRCQICSKTYKLKHHLKQHMEATHNEFGMISKSLNSMNYNKKSKSSSNLSSNPNSETLTFANTPITLIQNEAATTNNSLSSTLQALMQHIKSESQNQDTPPTSITTSTRSNHQSLTPKVIKLNGSVSPESAINTEPSVGSSRNLSTSPDPEISNTAQKHTNDLINILSKGSDWGSNTCNDHISNQIEHSNPLLQLQEHSHLDFSNLAAAVTNSQNQQNMKKRNLDTMQNSHANTKSLPTISPNKRIKEDSHHNPHKSPLEQLISKITNQKDAENIAEHSGLVIEDNTLSNQSSENIHILLDNNGQQMTTTHISQPDSQTKIRIDDDSPIMSDNENEKIMPKIIPLPASISTTPNLPVKNHNSTSSQNKSQPDVSKFHECSHCNIYFPDAILYNLHMGQHCVDDPFKCNICKHKCDDKYDFMCHFSTGKHDILKE